MANKDWTVRLRGEAWRDDPSGAENVNGFAGKALCADMAAALRAACPGATVGEPVAEDYGWGLSARLTGAPVWIAASCVGDGEDDAPEDDPPEYVVSVVAPKTSILPWKKPDPAAAADFAAVVAALEAWLAARGIAHQREA
ncbi:MAG: hypothetical protein JNK46_11420 [Methylobacteriaceae bacterium]|nr:hypothetical protein [Methylobacteriaceae bacterium]